jgi:hypothetical protein
VSLEPPQQLKKAWWYGLFKNLAVDPSEVLGDSDTGV